MTAQEVRDAFLARVKARHEAELKKPDASQTHKWFGTWGCPDCLITQAVVDLLEHTHD